MSDLRRAALTILWYALLAVVTINAVYTLGHGERLTLRKATRLEGLQARAQSVVQQVLQPGRAGEQQGRADSSRAGPAPEATPDATPETAPETAPEALPETEPPRDHFPDQVPRRISLPTLREKPSAYRRLFSWAARTYGVELALIRAVVRAESSGNPAAISHEGAIGIMQLMPKTARRYRPVDADRLHLPSLNVDIGTAHLRWLGRQVKARFPTARTNDRARVQLIAAGYNAGWQRVLQYRGVPPYRETRVYVRRVWDLYRRFSAAG